MASPRHLRSCLIYSATLIFITLAVCFSLLRSALPHAHGYVAELESTLSEQIGLPVDIDSLDAEMSWFTPRLILLNTRIYDEQRESELIAFERIEFSLSYFDSIRFMQPRIDQITLVLSEMLIERLAPGRWQIQGMELGDANEEMPDDLRSILENTSFALHGNSVHLIDQTGEYQEAVFEHVDISVSHFLGEHTLLAQLQLPQKYGDTLTAQVSYSGNIESVLTSETDIYLGIDHMEISHWLDRLHIESRYDIEGQHDVQLWMTMQDQQPRDVVVQLHSENISIRNDLGQSWQADKFASSLMWKQYNDNWRLYLKDLTYSRQGMHWRMPSNVIAKRQQDKIIFSADYLSLHDIPELLELTQAARYDDELAQLAGLDADTELYNVNIVFDTGLPQLSSIEFVASDLGFRHEEYAMTGLDLAVDVDAGNGSAVFVTEDATLADNKMFRHTIPLTLLLGVVDIRHDSHWHVATDILDVVNDDVTAQLRLVADWSEMGGLFLDIQSAYSDINGADVKRYYPVTQLDTDLLDWLDAAINDGTIPDGYFSFYGKASAFPFEHDGKMLARFNVQGMNLLFDSEWPLIEDLDADVLFEDKSLSIKGTSARTLGAKIDTVEADIDDLYESLLDVTGHLTTPVRDVQNYIWNSPLDKTLGTAMNLLQTEGQADLGLKLHIPLDDIDSMTVRGDLVFANSTIRYPTLEYRLADVAGKLHFTEDKIWSTGLKANFDGAALGIDIDTDADDKGLFTTIHFDGDIAADSLLTRFDWVPRDWLSGVSHWDMRLTIPHYASDHDVILDGSTDSLGLTVGVSDVLSKTPVVEYPLHISAAVNDDIITLTAGTADDQTVTGTRDIDGNWSLNLMTDVVRGKAEFHESMSVDSVIKLDLDSVNISDMFVRDSMKGETGSIPPSTVPSIKFEARDVDWKKWHFSSVSVTTTRHTHGMLMSDIDVQADHLQVSGSGTWLSGWRYPNETTFTLSARSDDFGTALVSQGYQRVLDRCEQTAEMVLQWPAEPYKFSWTLLNGTASIEMSDGVVTDIDAGTGGRLVGLLNVFQLPRRLIFDFSDINKDGYVFDSISSEFTFADGFATTRETEVLASVADMRITGKVDMQNEQYDLILRTKPHQSAATFTGGAIAGGPVVGAGLVLLQKLFNLDKASQDRYAITGSWDEPVVTQVSKAEVADSAQEEATDDEDQE